MVSAGIVIPFPDERKSMYSPLFQSLSQNQPPATPPEKHPQVQHEQNSLYVPLALNLSQNVFGSPLGDN